MHVLLNIRPIQLESVSQTVSQSVSQFIPAVKFQHFLAVLNEDVGCVARIVRGPRGGGLQLVEEHLLVEGDDQFHVPEDQVGLVGHA